MKDETALISDLLKLQQELPGLIEGVRAGDLKSTQDAIALVQGASKERLKLAMNNLTTYVLDEAKKGNLNPLRQVASLETFDRSK